ncbi:hypothetical protein BDR05DRAFT_999332 [Suillus weaverae]|nr:hypothetical protein BDR05DRAFT_999332 [Suillus weaverae]
MPQPSHGHVATHSPTDRLTHSLPVKALNDLTPSIIPITARAPTESLLIQSKKASSSGGTKPVRVTIPCSVRAILSPLSNFSRHPPAHGTISLVDCTYAIPSPFLSMINAAQAA